MEVVEHKFILIHTCCPLQYIFVTLLYEIAPILLKKKKFIYTWCHINQ